MFLKPYAAANLNRGENLLNQILILKKRLLIIRKIQLSGIFSFILSLISIFSILFEFMSIGKVFFTLGIIFMIITLSLAMWEIFISTLAIELEIERHFESLGSSDYDSVI